MHNAPLLIIYKPNEIPNINEMALYFKKRCVDEGFSGCSIVYQSTSTIFPKRDWLKIWSHQSSSKVSKTNQENEIDATADNIDTVSRLKKYVCDYFIAFEPQYTLNEMLSEMHFVERLCNAIKNRLRMIFLHFPQIMDYDKDWMRILARPFNDKRMFAGAFVNWDNTPRNKRGLAYVNASPEKFERYLGQLAEKVKESELHNIIFLTAWNEWGEGSYLEPDEENGYAYLTAVKRVVEKCS